MWDINSNYENPQEYFKSLKRELLSLVEGETNSVANLANMASWIFHSFPDLNWCGFYLWSDEDQELVLGPFQGRPACIRIKSGRGVCGKAHAEKTTVRVIDVNEFPGHIACDAESSSELVIPLMKGDKCLGVLDLDSPTVGRFSETDASELSLIVEELVPHLFQG